MIQLLVGFEPDTNYNLYEMIGCHIMVGPSVSIPSCYGFMGVTLFISLLDTNPASAGLISRQAAAYEQVGFTYMVHCLACS